METCGAEYMVHKNLKNHKEVKQVKKKTFLNLSWTFPETFSVLFDLEMWGEAEKKQKIWAPVGMESIHSVIYSCLSQRGKGALKTYT